MSFAIRQARRRERLAIEDDVCADASSRSVAAAYFEWKDYGGRCLAIVLFIAGLPIMAATMLLVRLTSRGPAIYRQIRVGRNGRTFRMYKIRTMRVDAEAATGPVWTQLHDPRITRVGWWLRKLHLDELPQIVNVLRGEMALIGPRPERPEFTRRLALEIPGYLDRLAVRPGITGLAQINLPPDTDTESVQRKLVLDLLYVCEGSLSLDLKILACTFARLFGIKGRRITRLFRLDYTFHLSQPISLASPSAKGNANLPFDAYRDNGQVNGTLHASARGEAIKGERNRGDDGFTSDAQCRLDCAVEGSEAPMNPQRRLPR
ncbi:MAG TPA: sugar transferase [Pirellulales bacterium]|nr:sugar transferase [Pirellulales bacterium]